jgi:integrase
MRKYRHFGGKMKLTATAVKNAKPGKHSDGEGMYLLVTEAGQKYWRFDYRFLGKYKTLALGVYPDTSLAMARSKRAQARTLLASDQDPSAVKRRAKANAKLVHDNTFQSVAAKWLETTSSQRKANTEAKLNSWLQRDVIPELGELPVSKIKTTDVLRILRKMEARGVFDSVLRVKQIVSRIMKFAVREGLVERDPTYELQGPDTFKSKPTKHHAAVTDPKAFGGLLRAIAGYEGHFVIKTALQLSPLVFVRPGELRAMAWVEVDLENAIWAIPGHRMKMSSDHIVPLSTQAVALLKDLHLVTGDRQLAFPSLKGEGRPLSENTINAALTAMGYDGTRHRAHGFRASARTMLDEQLGYPAHLIEHQLAHAVKDANGRAYNRTSHLEDRKEMMQFWADYLDKLTTGAAVLKLRAAA